MKKIYIYLVIVTLLIFISCGSDVNSIKKIIGDYQNSLNTYDYDGVKNLYDDPDSYALTISIAMIEALREEGINATYMINVMDVRVVDSVAEAYLKTSIKYSGENADTIKALSLFTPALTNSTMTFRKTNAGWKIIGEEITQ